MLRSQTARSARAALDPLWQSIREEVAKDVEREPLLASFLHATVLNHKSLEDALGFLLAGKLECAVLPAMLVRELIADAVEAKPGIGQSVRADIRAIRDRDPAAKHFSEPFLYFKGFHALQAYRIAHWLWHQGRKSLALYLQSRTSEVFGVDVHPAARIGDGILIDHATSVVVGETAVIEWTVENIGARRLHTVMEKILEEVSFNASERGGETVTVDAAYVRDQIGDLAKDADLSKFIL